jgi:putative ABC transport system permease protein
VPGPAFWLRWSGRDLRARWVLVVALALVIALATGMAAGLGSVQIWRDRSADASFGRLGFHDLRLTLTEGSAVPAGSLERLAGTIPEAGDVSAAQERLVVPAQVDASHGGETVLVPGRLVGAPVGGPPVDATAIERGRGLEPRDAGRAIAVLEANFGEHHSLPARGEVRISGGRTIRYVGQGRQPEYFVVTTPGAGFGAEAAFAVLFMPLSSVQALSGQPGRVNELVVRLAPGADARAVGRALQAALARTSPGLGSSVTLRAEEEAHRLTYTDAKNDQRFMNVFAWLLLGGAALAAFNLISRVVESQRREIGVGMALGVPPRVLAMRPLLFGVEVALVGVALGVAVGLGVAMLLRPVIASLAPLPVLETPFQPAVFARGAALGLAIPILASLYPVWRGVRIAPVEAIRVGPRAAAGSGLARLVRRLPLPGGSLGRMPMRNVVRTPRRTLLSVLAIGAVISVVVALGGLFDSFGASLAQTREEALAGSPDRMTAVLQAPVPVRSLALDALPEGAPIAEADPGLRLAASVGHDGRRFDVQLDLVDAAAAVWRPRVSEGSFPAGRPGIVLSWVAARDLGVGVGDRISLTHPVRTGPGAFRTRTTPVAVAAINPSPYRFAAYMDLSQATLMGLAGSANVLEIQPAPGADPVEVQRALFGRPGIASVQPAAAATDAAAERMEEFLDILRFAQAVVLAITLLIAFNTTTISGEERAREQATMLAFGVPGRRVLGQSVLESAMIGIMATAVGIAAGLGILSWVLGTLSREVFPELGVGIAISAETIATAVLVGVVAVAAAPLLGARRLRRMDIPSTLRVVE